MALRQGREGWQDAAQECSLWSVPEVGFRLSGLGLGFQGSGFFVVKVFVCKAERFRVSRLGKLSFQGSY